MEFRHHTKEDVTSHKRSPAEESFYESFLLQKESTIGNLYASNLYQMQCYSKTVKHIDKQRNVHAAEMNREMKKIQKKMDSFKDKSHKKQFASEKSASSDYLKDAKMARRSAQLPRMASRPSHLRHSPPLLRAFTDLNFESTKGLSRSCTQLSTPACNEGQRDKKGNNKTGSTDRGLFITNAKTLQSNNQNYSSHLSVKDTHIKTSLRASKSHEDLNTIGVVLDRRTRANTIAKFNSMEKPRNSNDLNVRYIPREDRVKTSTILPRI